MKTFEISAHGHLFGYWRASSPEDAYEIICRESCTREPMDSYEIIHHHELDQLTDEEIYDLNLSEAGK